MPLREPVYAERVPGTPEVLRSETSSQPAELLIRRLSPRRGRQRALGEPVQVVGVAAVGVQMGWCVRQARGTRPIDGPAVASPPLLRRARAISVAEVETAVVSCAVVTAVAAQRRAVQVAALCCQHLFQLVGSHLRDGVRGDIRRGVGSNKPFRPAVLLRFVADTVVVWIYPPACYDGLVLDAPSVTQGRKRQKHTRAQKTHSISLRMV